MCFLKGCMHERVKTLRRGQTFASISVYCRTNQLTLSCKNSIPSKSGGPIIEPPSARPCLSQYCHAGDQESNTESFKGKIESLHSIRFT